MAPNAAAGDIAWNDFLRRAGVADKDPESIHSLNLFGPAECDEQPTDRASILAAAEELGDSPSRNAALAPRTFSAKYFERIAA